MTPEDIINQANIEYIPTAAACWDVIMKYSKKLEQNPNDENLQYEIELARDKYSLYADAYFTFVPETTPEKFLRLIQAYTETGKFE